MNSKHFTVLFLLFAANISFVGLTFEGFVKPAHFPEPVYDVQSEPVTAASFRLGKKLFYETALSRDNTISCGFCHIQSAAFTQHGHDVSHGIDDRVGSRNSPPIMNLAWNTSFFWDGGIFHLDLFPVSPITNPLEMDADVDSVLAKLREKPGYSEQFKAVYGTGEITANRMFRALSHFMIMCISSNSKYDSVMQGHGVKFTDHEQKGYKVFQEKCGSCHKEPLFTDGSFRNNGLDMRFNADSGRQAITLNANDRYKFKVPSLRNLTFTAPYMHDGRFTSIDEVLDHYQHRVHSGPTLDTSLLRNGRQGIELSIEERTHLKEFLLTLNDRNFITRHDLSEE